MWRGGRSSERELLASAHASSLRVAGELGAESVAFPAISCGVYGFPVEEAAPIALEAARVSDLPLIRFVLFDDVAYDAFARAASV